MILLPLPLDRMILNRKVPLSVLLDSLVPIYTFR